MDRWIRVEGTRARVTASGHTGAGSAYSCPHTRGKTSRMPCAGLPADVPYAREDVRMIDAAGRWPVDGDETRAANRAWWDGEADDYYAEHGAFLGDSRVRLGAGGLDRGRARPARGARRHDGARDRRRRRPVLPLAGAPPRRAGRGERPVDGHAAHGATDRRAHGSALPLRAVRRAGAAPGRRERRPRVHGLRRRALRRRQRRGARARPPGCCGRAGGSSSRRRTRCGGRSPTTRGRTG